MIDAAKSEPQPIGSGSEVLPFVLEKARTMASTNPRYFIVTTALIERAEMGKAKYGTYLRAQNGRDCQIDYFQELLDAVMYSGQCLMEGKLPVVYFWATLNLTVCVAEAISEGARESLRHPI